MVIDPIDALIQEHRIIEQVLMALARASELGRSGVSVPPSLFTDVVAFVRRYADGVHHAKEEQHLFPMLERSGVARGSGPVGCMLAEHDGARRYADHMEEEAEVVRSGGVPGSTLLYQVGLVYSHHMARHIQKEDGMLFPLARVAIHDGAKVELAAAFARIDAETPGFEASAAAIAATFDQASWAH